MAKKGKKERESKVQKTENLDDKRSFYEKKKKHF